MSDTPAPGGRRPRKDGQHTREGQATGTTEATRRGDQPSPADGGRGGGDSLHRLFEPTGQQLRLREEDPTPRSKRARPPPTSPSLRSAHSLLSLLPPPRGPAARQTSHRHRGDRARRSSASSPRPSPAAPSRSAKRLSVLEAVCNPGSPQSSPSPGPLPHRSERGGSGVDREPGAAKKREPTRATHRPQERPPDQGRAPASNRSSKIASGAGASVSKETAVAEPRVRRRHEHHDDDEDSSSSDSDDTTAAVSAKRRSLLSPAAREDVGKERSVGKVSETDGRRLHPSCATEPRPTSDSRDKPGSARADRSDPRDLRREPQGGSLSVRNDSSTPASSLKKQAARASTTRHSPPELGPPPQQPTGTEEGGLALQRKGAARKARAALLAQPRWTEAVVPAQILFGEIARCRSEPGSGAGLDPEADRALDAWHAGVARRLGRQNRLVLRNLDAVHRERLVARHVDRVRADLVAQRRAIRRLKREVRVAKRRIEDKKARDGKRRAASRFLSALDRLRR